MKKIEEKSQEYYLTKLLDDLDHIGRENWLPDNSASTCFKCNIPFTFRQRRHHCRVCGNLFCSECCKSKPITGRRENAEFKICEKCFTLLNQFAGELEHKEKQYQYHAKVSMMKLKKISEESKNEANDVAEPLLKNEEKMIAENEIKRKPKSLSKIEEEHILKICRKLCEDNEIPQEYEEKLSQMVLQAVSNVKPSITIKDGMKFTDFVKIKLIPNKDISYSRYINGVVFTKNVADKKMKTDISEPKILLINGNLAENKERLEIDSFHDILALEEHFAKKITRVISGIKPSVVLIEKSASIQILEKLREQNITVFCNVKESVMNRISRLTGTVPCPTADLLSRQVPLGKCNRVCVLGNIRTGKEAITRIDRSYCVFEGCIESLGCTICIAGQDQNLLKKVKNVLRQILYFSRDIALETAFLTGLNINFQDLDGRVYLMDAIGMPRYINGKEINIIKLYLTEGEIQYNSPNLNEDTINKKGRRLCGEPAKIKLECYKNDGDTTFGEFITDIMKIVNEECPICTKKRINHQIVYYHGHGKLTVSVELNHEHIYDSSLYIKGKCKKCGNTKSAPQKIGELYELSLAKFLISYFYNSELKSANPTCGHFAIQDYIYLIYNKEMCVKIEYNEKEVYSCITGGTVFDNISKAVSVATPNLIPKAYQKEIISSYSMEIIPKYGGAKDVVQNAYDICQREHIKPLIKSVLDWLEATLLEIIKQRDKLLLGEDTPADTRKMQNYATNHICILQQLRFLVDVIIKAVEPLKDSSKEIQEEYDKFLTMSVQNLQEDVLSLTNLNSLQPAPILGNKKPRSGSVGATNEVAFCEIDHGLIIANAMRSKEYKEALEEIIRSDKTELNCESMELDLLSSRNYGIRLEMGGGSPNENKEVKNANPGAGIVTTIYKNHEKHEFVPDPSSEKIENKLMKLTDNEKMLEKNLTEIVTFRTSIQKAMEVSEVHEPIIFSLAVTEEVISEVNDIIVHLKHEQTANTQNERLEVFIYSANQFMALRNCLNLDEEEYLDSLSKIVPWKDVSGGKAKATFCKSKDGRLILKFIKKKEKELFEKSATQYFKHMCKTIAHEMPSIMVRNLGMYKIKIGSNQTCEIVVMENVCYGMTPTVVYDLKGSLKRRYVKREERINSNRVLLDTNFKEDHSGEPLVLDEESGIYLQESIHNDTLLLSRMNVMDYSLLAVIDEKNRTMKAGILDIFREFNSAELLEYHTKRAINLGENPTVIEPNSYKMRFRAAMKKYFVGTSTIESGLRSGYTLQL